MQPVTITKHEVGSDGMTLYVQFSDDNICSLDAGGGVTNHKTKALIGAIPPDKWDPTLTDQQKMIWVTSIYLQHLRTANSLEAQAQVAGGNANLAVGSSAVLANFVQSGNFPTIPQQGPTPEQQIAKELASISGRVPIEHLKKQPRRNQIGQFKEPEIYDE